MSSNGESSAVSSGGAENVAGTSGDMFKYTAKEIEAMRMILAIQFMVD